MTYFYNSDTGKYANESPPSPGYFIYEADLHTGLGWHAYGSQALMEAAVKANGWPAPTTSSSQALKNASPGAYAGDVAGAGATSVVNDALKPLFQSAIWLRVAEVALGLLLIAVGLAKLTNAVPIATKIAEAVK